MSHGNFVKIFMNKTQIHSFQGNHVIWSFYVYFHGNKEIIFQPNFELVFFKKKHNKIFRPTKSSDSITSNDSSQNLRTLPCLQKKKKMLSKIEMSVRDNCKHISISEIGNLKVTDKVKLFLNRVLIKTCFLIYKM